MVPGDGIELELNTSMLPFVQSGGVKYSVVVPTCHRNDLLEKCLLALAPKFQTIDPAAYEVIVTDDGRLSTAENMVKEQFPSVRWVSGPKKGPAANRNNGANQARGSFIVFIDDDCVPAEGWLLAYDRAVLDGVEVYEGKTTLLKGLNSPLEAGAYNLSGGNLWSCNMMIRKTVFETLGGFDDTFPHAAHEDLDFRMRLVAAGYTFPFVAGALVDHVSKRLVWGRRTASFWEGRVILWYKTGNSGSVLRWLLPHVLKVRLRQILNFPLSLDSLLAVCGLVTEWLFVAARVRGWQRKYGLSIS